MANSQQNPFLDLTADINVQGIVDSLKDASTQTQINAAFEKLFAAGTKEAAKEAVDDFINAFQSLKNKAPQDIFKDTFKPAELKGAETQLKNIFAQIDGFLAGTKNADFSNNVVVQLLKRITDAGTRIAELNKTKVNIEVNPASFKSFDDLARRLELALADVARLNEELAQGVAQGNLKVSPEVQNSVENTANQVANLGKQVEFLSKEVLAFISVLQTKIGETSGATSFVGKILGIDSETILKQLGDFTKQLEDLGRRSSQSFAKGFAEGGQDSARDAVRSIVSDLATELTKIKDLSTIKFEGLGQFDKITTAADALLDVLDKVVGKELQVEDLFNKVITGKGRTKFRPVAPIELPEGTIGLDKSLSPEKASQVVKSLNETFFQRIVSYAVESSRQFRNAFTEANNALEIDFRATFQTITEILEKFVATAETLVPKIFKLGQGEGDSDAKLISERLKSIQEEITKTEEAQAAARTKAQKKEFDQKIESLKLYQKGLESAQAKGGFTVGGTAAEEHLDKEAKQLQEIVNLIVEIGKQSKIAGVLILLKGPNEHFAKEIELLKGINSQIVQVGNAAQVASLEVAKLGDNVKLEQFKKNLGEIQAALELAREQLSSSKGTAEIGDLLVIDQRKVKARLAEVEAAIREFTARAQADLKAPGTTQIRELEDRLRRLRDDAREVSSLLREAKTPDDFRVLGDAKQEIKEEILEVRDALIKARREFQDNLSGDFKAEIASLKKARADLLAEKNKLSREFDASYSKELNSLIASLEKKIQALEKEEAKLKGIILGSEQPQTGGAQEDQEDQRIKAAKATADAIKEIEKALKGASTAGSTLADILTKIDRPTRAGTLTSTGLAGGVLGDPTATPAITEALNKTKASQAELARLTQEGAAQRLKVFAQEREDVLDLINRATSERVALTQKAEAQVEALIEKSGATQEKREELRLAKESAFAAERARIKADAEAAIQKLDLKTTQAGDLVIEAQEKRIKRLVTNYENAKKSLETLSTAFQGLKPFSTQGFGVGGGSGAGPLDFGNIGDTIGKLPQLFKNAEGAVDPYIAVIAKAAEVTFQFIKAAKALVDNALEFAKNQRQLSQAFDIQRENIAAFTLGFQRAGQPVFSLDIALSSLQQKIEAAFAGDEKAALALQRLGASAEKSEGQIASLDDVLGQIARNAATTGETAEKAASRVQLFGIFGQRAVGITIKQFEQLRKEAVETGLALSEQAEGSLFNYYSSITRIEAVVQGVVNTFAVGFAPAFTKFNESLGDIIKSLDLANPETIEGLASALGKLLDVVAFGVKTLADFKSAIDTIANPLNGIIDNLTSDKITEKQGGILELIGKIADGLASVIKPAQSFRFGVLSAAYDLGGFFRTKFDPGSGPEKVAELIGKIGDAAKDSGDKLESLALKVARFKRESDTFKQEEDEKVADIQAKREEQIDAIRRQREQGEIGPLAAAQKISEIQIKAAEEIIRLRQQAFERERDQVKEISGLSIEEARKRLETEKRIIEERESATDRIALREAENQKKLLNSQISAARTRVDTASIKLDTVSPIDAPGQQAARREFEAAKQDLAQLQLAAETVAATIESIRVRRAKATEEEAKSYRDQVRKEVDDTSKAAKDKAQAEKDGSKVRQQVRAEEFKAAQEERDNLLKQGTASLQEAVNKEIGIIQERAERGIITEKAAAAQKLKLEREVLEAKLKIQEGFARGANQPVKGQDTTSLAGIYDKEIQFYEKRVAFQKEAIALDKERAEGEKLLGEEAYQRAQEDEQFLENLKRKRDEVVQARIEGLRKERDAAKPESIERARLDAEIAANQAILDGRIQTQEQITKNEQEMSQTRAELAKNEASGKKTAIEEEIANRSRLIQIAQNELNLLEARANAQQEAIKRQSGLTQEQIDAGAADYELTRARINASIRLLQAKLAILDAEIANARAINANAPEIISLEAQRLDIATQLNEVLRTRFELLDKAAAKEREAFSKGAGAAGGGTRSTDDPLFGAPQSYEEGQAAILAAIKAQREAGAEAFNGLGTLYTYYANLVGEATKAGADQITGLIDKLQADIRGLTNPGGAQIAGLLNYFTNQAKDALQAAFRRRDELLSAEAEKAAKEAADKALAERKRVEDGVKAIAQRQADAEKAAAERLEEQLKDLRKQREDAIREDAERRIELQEDLAKRQADLEKRFIEEDIARARQAARDKFDLELDFIRSLAQARFDAATQAFNAAKDFAKKDYDLRQSLAKNDTSIQDAEKAYRDQLGKVQETKTKLDHAKTAADRERLQAELRADTEALNANLKAIADLQKEREALRKDREAAAKVRDLERQRQQQLADLFRRAALGELDKEELELLVRQLNQRFDLERDYINDRNEAAKTGDAEYLQQIEDAYNQQKEAQAELHRQELAADKKFREEKKRRELEDEGLRQADRAKQRQDLIDDYNDQLKDLDKALEKRLNAIKENEKKVKDEYKSTLDKIKEDSAKALAELGIAYDKFFEGLVEKVKNVGTEVGKVLKSIGDLANGLPDTKGSGDSSSGGSGGPTTTSSEGNPNGPSVGSGYQNPKDAPKGGPSTVGPANPSTGGASGPSSSSGYQNPKDAPKGGPSTVGPTTPGGSGGGSSTTSSAGLGLRNKGQGGGNDLSGTADNGNRITFSGLSSEVLTNDIINKATGLKRGERATPKSAIEVLDYALNPYHYDKDGKKVYEPAYISQADYARAVKRIKDFYQPANIEALYKRHVITASYAVGMVEDAFAAGFYGKQKADPEYTRLRKAAFFEGNGDNTYAKYGDIIKALEDGKISPAQAWDQAARRSRLIGGDLDARRVAVYLKEFWGYNANPGDAFRPQGYDPAKDTGPALTTEGGGTPGLGSDTPNTSTGDLNNIISGGTLLAGASSIAGKGDLSSVGEIQGATPTYDTASVVDIGPVNLTGAPGKVKKGNEVKQKKYNPTNAPIGPPVNQPTKFSKGNPRSGPGPDVSPRRGFKKQIATEKPIKPESPVIEAYNEIEGVKKLKAEFRRIFDYASAGTHTRQEIQSEINISAGLVTYLGNKGLFKEPGGIKYETYRRAIADLLALAQLTPEGFATFTSSPFFEGKYVPPPGDTNPALSYSPASPPTILPSSPTLSSIGGVTDLSTLQAVTTPSLPSYNIQAGSGGSQYSAGNPSASDITGAFRDAAPIVRSAAGAVTNAIRTMLKDAITLAAREMSNQIVSDISVGRHAR